MTTILLPAGCQHVSYIELAELMAKALNKGEDRQALAAYFIAENNLPDAVRRGELLVRSGFSHAPLSTAPMVDAHGNDSSIILLDDLRDFLKGWGIAVEVEQPAQVARPAPAAQVEPVQAGPAKRVLASDLQDAAILGAIREAGYDPMALPRNPPGKPGIKAAIRKALVGVNGAPFPKFGKQFDKSWDRLRERGEITDA